MKTQKDPDRDFNEIWQADSKVNMGKQNLKKSISEEQKNLLYSKSYKPVLMKKVSICIGAD